MSPEMLKLAGQFAGRPAVNDLSTFGVDPENRRLPIVRQFVRARWLYFFLDGSS